MPQSLLLVVSTTYMWVLFFTHIPFMVICTFNIALGMTFISGHHNQLIFWGQNNCNLLLYQTTKHVIEKFQGVA